MSGNFAGLTANEVVRLHELYAQRLLAYAITILRNREDAEDAVQTVFLNAYKALMDGRLPRDEVSWLFRITRNVCLNRLRSHQRKSAGSINDLELVASDNVEERFLQQLHATTLKAAIERLPTQQRTAIVLRELRGASYAEIAAAMETTQGAVESLIFRARGQLACAIKATNSTLEPARLALAA